MAVGVDVDAGHGRFVLAGRPDAHDGPVAGALQDAAQELAAGQGVLAPEVAGLDDVDAVLAQMQDHWGVRPADDDQGVEAGEAQGQGAAAAGVGLGVLAVQGRGEGADRLAHERKVAGQGADGEDQGLGRIIPGQLGLGVIQMEFRGQAGAAQVGRGPSISRRVERPVDRFTSRILKVLPDHASTSCQFQAVMGAELHAGPQWMQTKTWPRRSWAMASTGQAATHLPHWMQSFFCCMTPPPFSRLRLPVGQAVAQGAGSQARQTLARKPEDMPPEDWMRMPAFSQDRHLCTTRAQAREQEWQPMHRSMRVALSCFMSDPVNG
jgi:hypothetical protein